MPSLRLWITVVCLCLGAVLARAESLGPASKRTALIISEVMYHPADRADGKNLEFIEIYNSDGVSKKIGGFRLAGDVSFLFPEGMVIAARSFVTVAAVPADVQSVYGLAGALGPFTGSLPNGSGRIELWSKSGALLLEVDYRDDGPWPAAADGMGHSLVLARPTYGQNEVKAWAASLMMGGSPGAVEPTTTSPLDALMINEILAHTDDPVEDYVEIYNRSSATITLTGCIITDDTTVDKFVIPSGQIGPFGFVQFKQSELGFALSSEGETIYLKNPTNTRVIDAVRFGGQENGVASGRFPNGSKNWYPLTAQTPGAANAGLRQSPVVINELMYSPISEDDEDQYVELHNSSGVEVDLSGWQLEDGIEFTFPTGTKISAGGFLVVARNSARLLTRYANLTADNCLGNFSGRLAGSGERVVLTKPDTIIVTDAGGAPQTVTIHIPVDEVTYETGGRWTEWADGGGSSLELIDPRANHRLAANWAASDETKKAPWTLVEHTGTLDNGATPPNQLQMHMQGPGECLVDNVEVFPAGGANLIANSTFESGISGWTAEGTQDQSGHETTEGFNSARSYHLRAVDRGDTGANRIRTPLTSQLTVGSTATIRAQVRWLRGRPEMLLRLRGNYLEAIGQLTVPTNLGTPGAQNSRASANTGPAIYDVIHSPVLPAANQAFVVTARVEDPDALNQVQLTYRLDGTATTATLTMQDNGTSGDAAPNDGVYSATIPGSPSGTIVAFRVRAVDAFGAQNLFPTDAPSRECLVRIGESQPAGVIGTYRLWMTAATRTRWASRHVLDNTPFDVTFVFNNERVIYNLKALYAGSPYIAPGYSGPTAGLCGYTGEFPKDDLFLGVNDFVLDWPGRDTSAVAEQMSYFLADEVGLPNSHRRFIHLHVNGVNEQTRGSIYEDVQQPGGDMIKEWSAGDEDGNFYKIERWFEFNDEVQRITDPQPKLANFTTTGGAKKLAAYRWMFMPRAVVGSVNDFDDIFAWADAANAQAPEPYTSQMEALTDMEEVMGIFAMERVINNFDSWGHYIGKNMYAYKPRNGRWLTFMFDNDWLMEPSSALGYNPSSPLFTPVDDPAVARMFNHPPFRRAFLRTIQKAVAAMDPDNINPRMNAQYAMLQASGVTRSAGNTLASPAGVQNWLSQRRAFMVSQLSALNAAFAITSNGGNNFESPANVVTLTGTAPIEVTRILVNGLSYPITWSAVTTWNVSFPLSAASTRLILQAVTETGAVVGTDEVTVTFNGPIETPEGRIVFNEVMYHPPVSGAAFIELKSLASTTSYDLSNWRIEGVGFTFPTGTILPPGGYLVVANDPAAFAAAYGAVPLAGVFPGQLRNDSETIWLLKPGATPGQETVIDQLTYADQAPWPTAADGLGGSLQLIDAAQDNSRVVNWAALTPQPGTGTPQTLVNIDHTWKYDQSGVDLDPQWTGDNFNDATWLSGAGLLYVEGADLPGPKNTPLALGRRTYYFRSHFNFTGNPAEVDLSIATVVDDGVAVYLNGHVLHQLGVDEPLSYSAFANRLVDNALFEGPVPKSSTWLRQGDNVIAAEVHQNNEGSSDIVFGLTLESIPRVSPVATPGAQNSVARTLAPFPKVWINEIQPVNLTGIADESGERDPWVELYNSGPATVSLNGWYLSDSATTLTRWAFPANAQIESGQRLLVWLDAGTGSTALHANFRAAAESGTIALIFPFEGSSPAVLDYINYNGVPNDRSVGRFPDGDGSDVELFFNATPGGANDNSAPALPLFINEWMAANTTIRDPSDQDFDDWFEIYNPNNVEVDLTGYALTDDLMDPLERYTIPSGWKIGPGQFMLIWADDETPLGATQLHVPFNLARGGDSIGLYAPNGSLVDSVTFGPQASNISAGRTTDGGPEIDALDNPTPGASNVPSFQITSVTSDPARNLTIRWQAVIGHDYQLQYKNTLSGPLWNELKDVTATATTAEATDPIGDGTRFYRVIKK